MRLVPFFVLALPTLTLAWSGDGHQQIADIAWTKLTPTAKAKIEKILNAGEPKFQVGANGVRDAFRYSATFCDYMKNKNDTIFEDIIPTMNSRFNANVASLGNEGSRCKTWHYYDEPIRYQGAKPEIDPSNADVALRLSINELAKLNKGGLSDLKTACWWLYWIEHVTGDLHQPLHCVSNYEANAKGDAGGNKVKIEKAEGSGNSNLHSLWDGGIGRAVAEDRKAGLDPNVEKVSERWAMDSKLQPTAAQVNDLMPINWILNGAKLADTVVYRLSNGSKPDGKYLADETALCRKQAVLAGFRLAAILNKALE